MEAKHLDAVDNLERIYKKKIFVEESNYLKLE